MSVCLRFVGVLSAIGCLAVVTAPVASAEWRRIDTPNFIVIGDVSARNLREVATEFESFRETLGRVLNARATMTPVPTVVVVFPNDRAFTPFKPLHEGKPVDVAGVFYGGRDVNYITLVHDGRPGGLRIVFHEYAHLVIANVAGQLPAWLNEGLAEYYSTYEYRRGGREAMIGRPIDSHLRLLVERRPLPLSELITVDHTSALYNERDRRSIFYAQSWALTHMLLLGQPPRVQELAAYVGHIQNGIPERDAWRQAFGDVDLDRALSNYLRQPAFAAYAFKFSDQLTTVDMQASTLAPEAVAGFLAGLRIRQQRHDEADALLRAAEAGAGGHVRLARAQLDLARDEDSSAAEHLMRVGDADDWFVAYSAGMALASILERAPNTPEDRLAAARARLEDVRRDRELPHVLARLAMLDVLSPQGASAGTLERIERARALAPGREEYALVHARVLAGLGDFARARGVLGPLMVPGMPDHVRSNARAWMGAVVRMEEAATRVTERRLAGTAAGGTASADPKPGAGIPPGVTHLVLRRMLPGEQRVEGTLVAIDCRPGSAAVTFRLATPDGPRTFAAPGLGAVDFITYRENTGGAINCGPLEPPIPVYVTWRDGAAPGTTTVVAVEFLPGR
jgi:hypothetical protein